MVATVFKISQPGTADLILKVCSRKEDFLRESYFLSRFAGKIPVPKIIQLIEPEAGLDAAVVMECVLGDLLKLETIPNTLVSEIGSLLARIHLNQALADEDVEAFKLSLKDIIRVHGKVSQLAKEAHLSRGTLYKLMQGKGQAEIGTILKLIHALGYDLTVTRRIQTA